MSVRLAAAVVFLFGLAPLVPAVAQGDSGTERRIVTVQDADYHGFDYETLREVTIDQCTAACIADGNCSAFTYNTSAGWCFLKSDHGELQSFSGAVAGRIVEVARQSEALPGPDLSFVPDWIADEAQTYAGRVRDARRGDGLGVEALAARAGMEAAAGQMREAAELLRGALALAPDDPAIWRDLARVLTQIAPRDYSEQWRLQEEATSAAYGAVTAARSAPARVAAYGVLAEALAARDLYRPALEAYKAGLAHVDDPAIRAAYDALRAEHGFRVVDYTVESDAPSPRICVQFSEDLRSARVDFAPYVRLDGQPPEAVSAEERQLCLEGVMHGQRYRVTVRAGLPSDVDEVIERPAELDIYVRDRAPSVRFTGRNFVLPRLGSRGIPMVSVNTEAVDLELYRIGERSLAGSVTEGRFLGQLSGWQAEEIGSERGARIWQGTLEARRELNAEVVTSFPLDEALSERRPGVYVLRARAGDAAEQMWQPQATQWFVVSDIGLTTFMGDAGLDVFARSLDTAEPMEGVTVRLVARNNEVLGDTLTGNDGRAHFSAGLVRGAGGLAPGLVTAESGELDFAFLDLTRPGFDLSDRGVAGRPAPGAIDLFLYTERGVYRPGETVHLTALVRDDMATAIRDLPLTFIVTRPDGVEDRREVSRPGGGGAHQLDLPLVGAAMRGSWRVTAHSHAKGPAIAGADFLVEDFVPDRIEFDLMADGDMLPLETPLGLEVDGRFLYGAPASDLRLEGELLVSAGSERADLPGYRFGLADEDVDSLRERLDDLPRSDADGRASFQITAPVLPATTRPLRATVVVRMQEAGGRAVERRLELPVEASGPMIGVRPLFSDEGLGEAALARFDIVGVDSDGTLIDMAGLDWELLRIERNFQWYRTDGAWNYEPVNYTTRIADGGVDVNAGGPVALEVPVDSGRYRLEVFSADPDGPATSIEFNAGRYAEAADLESPDLLDISLDRPVYGVGDTARLAIAPGFAGTALIAVVGEGLIDTREVAVGADGVTVDLEVSAAWAPGVYVTATLYRAGDSGADHMPARAVGLTWLGLDSSGRTLAVALDLPEIVRPRESLAIPASVSGLGPGETAHLTVAAVDVGILNLTGYEPPRPDDWYFGQRRLSMEMRDLYGSLIDGMRGETGRLRSGGSDPGAGLLGSPPAQDTVALFSGIVAADADGRATVAFDIPEFNGTLRVMAVAWTNAGIGHGTVDVVVRDPVVIMSSLPRFLAPGDTSRLRLDIDNVDGPAGHFSLSVATKDNISVDTPEPSPSINLEEGARHALSVPLRGVAPGEGELTVRLTHESGLDIVQRLSMPVRPAEAPITERQVVSLVPGQSLVIDGELLSDRVPGTGFVTLSLTQAGRLDLPSLVQALDRFPYGCAEQVTSRGLPLLYLSQVAQEAGLGDEPAIRERVRGAIRDVLANQSASGGFGLWGPGSGDMWLDSYVTDFLTRAHEAGYQVPALALGQALDNLSNTLAFTDNATTDGPAIAYALYVLARNQRAAISDLRYYVDTALDDFATPLARAQLGAALALYGEGERSGRAFASAYARLEAGSGPGLARGDYGSPLRDGAAMLTLAAEAGSDAAPLSALLDFIGQARHDRRATSTQENAWMLLAAHALLNDDTGISLELNGLPFTGNLVRRYSGELLAQSPMTIRNTSDRELDAVMTVTGVPAEPHGAEAEGFEISRSYFLLDGTLADVSTIAQNERLVVVLEGREHNDWPSQILVVDMLPAGFEIDNPRLVASGNVAALDWLDETSPAHVEFRDDRFVAAFDRGAGAERGFTLAYTVRAVSPGEFAHPAATVEDMYRPHLSARTASARLEVLGPRP